jgi:hypothetical protein
MEFLFPQHAFLEINGEHEQEHQAHTDGTLPLPQIAFSRPTRTLTTEKIMLLLHSSLEIGETVPLVFL